MHIQSRNSEILPFVSRPSRYLGGEYNAIHKDPSQVRLKVALAFPDAYEIGMSHLGLKILYHILNSHPQVLAERVFAPWIDAEILHRKKGILLSSQESGLPLSSFDILGFTLQYELSYTNLLNMLELSGIPFRRAERGEGFPLVIAGGPCALNPEPLADFVDLFVVGEAEEAILEIAEEFLSWKGSGQAREALMERLGHCPGIYSPALDQEDRVIERRWIQDLDSAPYPTAFVVPFLEIVHDRLNLEVGRGCSEGCRFCQAGMIFRPTRERSVDRIRDLILRCLRETGYEEVSLSSLNTTDYSYLESLLPPLMDVLERQKISLSLPSIRIDGLNLKILEQIKRVRKTGLTLAPEAGSQRLRDVINKRLDEESVLDAARAAASMGWKGLKLYFMIGLPTEREGDIVDIIRLSREALRAGKREGSRDFHLTVSISSFIPKPHTPFQWIGQAPMEELRGKLQLLRDRMGREGLTLKWQSPEMSFLEAVFSRGDRALGRAIGRAHSLGCRFDGWTEQFRFDLWQKAFSDLDMDPGGYSYRHWEPGAHLPWDHISAGLSKQFLCREYERALTGQVSGDCRFAPCLSCGLDCPPRRPSQTLPLPVWDEIRAPDPNGPSLQRSRIRFRFQKGEEARYLSHLEIVRTFSRALRRGGLPVSYSQGFHPQPRLMIAWPLPVGVCGEEEWGEMELEGQMLPSETMGCLNPYLPLGLSVSEMEQIPRSSPSLESFLSRALYRICLDPVTASEWTPRSSFLFSPGSPTAFLGADSITARTKRKGREVLVDLKPLIHEFFLAEAPPSPCWQLTLRLDQRGCISPLKVMSRLFSNYLDEEEANQLVLRLKINRKALF